MLPEPESEVTVALAAGELSVCAATRLEHARKAAVMVLKIVAPLLGDRCLGPDIGDMLRGRVGRAALGKRVLFALEARSTVPGPKSL